MSSSRPNRQSWAEAVAWCETQALPYVLITVLGVAGSTPRNAGTKMVVTQADSFATIGGGHLEFTAIEQARALLTATATQPTLRHFPLGASLGQCCGGSVSVLFEPMAVPRPTVQVHGAGHVGQALVPLLAQLPLRVQWVDSRPQQLPVELPVNVHRILEPEPVDAVPDAPPGTFFVILTHNHPLDFALCEAILKRGDAGFLGVIGSQTKAKRFRLRLAHKAYSAAQIDQLTCPIGLPAVGGKLPMEVAVAIAAQIIAAYQALQAAVPQRQGVQWRQLTQQLGGLTPVEASDAKDTL